MGADSETEERANPWNELQPKQENDMADPKTDTAAAAAVAGVGAKEHTVQGTDAETTHDAARSRRDAGFDTQMTRENADINVEEQSALHGMQQSHLWDANSKTFFDLILGGDMRVRNSETEQRLTHQANLNAQTIAAREQTGQFRDANATMQIEILSKMADSVAMCAAACAALAKK